MLIPRNFPITLRLTLYFSLAMGLVLYSVTGLLYSTMRNQLGQKDVDELRSTLRFQQEIATTQRAPGAEGSLAAGAIRVHRSSGTAVAADYQPGR